MDNQKTQNEPAAPQNDQQPGQPNQQPQQPQQPPTNYVDDYTPPAGDQSSQPAQPSQPPQQPEASNTTASNSKVSQALEDQNIFFLLGVTDGTDEEREAFLDELQQVIWEDFLDNDVELLVTEEEMEGMKKIMARKELSDEQMQEETVVYLEKLIPDLEEIMLEKALELKEDMVRERIAGMREYYAQDEKALAEISEAEALLNDSQWRDAAEKLNSISK